MAQEPFDSRRYFMLLRQINMEQQEMSQLQSRMIEQSQVLNNLILSSIRYDGGPPDFDPEVRDQLETRRMLLAVLFHELDRKRDFLFMLHMELGSMEQRRGRSGAKKRAALQPRTTQKHEH